MKQIIACIFIENKVHRILLFALAEKFSNLYITQLWMPKNLVASCMDFLFYWNALAFSFGFVIWFFSFYGFGRYADLKNNRLTNYTFNFDQMLNDKVLIKRRKNICWMISCVKNHLFLVCSLSEAKLLIYLISFVLRICLPMPTLVFSCYPFYYWFCKSPSLPGYEADY